MQPVLALNSCITLLGENKWTLRKAFCGNATWGLFLNKTPLSLVQYDNASPFDSSPENVSFLYHSAFENIYDCVMSIPKPSYLPSK